MTDTPQGGQGYGWLIAALERRMNDLSGWQDGILRRIEALETVIHREGRDEETQARIGRILDPLRSIPKAGPPFEDKSPLSWVADHVADALSEEDVNEAFRKAGQDRARAAGVEPQPDPKPEPRLARIGAVADALPISAEDERIVGAAVARAMGEREVRPMPKPETGRVCKACDGRGWVPNCRTGAFGGLSENCPACSGTGVVPKADDATEAAAGTEESLRMIQGWHESRPGTRVHVDFEFAHSALAHVLAERDAARKQRDVARDDVTAERQRAEQAEAERDAAREQHEITKLSLAQMDRINDELRAEAERLQHAWWSACARADAAEAALAEERKRREGAESEVVRLRELINRDRTGLGSALNGVRVLVRGWSWIGREEWGPYSYEDHTSATLQREWREFADQALTLIERGLRESGDRANVAYHPSQPDRNAEIDELRSSVVAAQARVRELEGELYAVRAIHEGALRAERELAGSAAKSASRAADLERRLAAAECLADATRKWLHAPMAGLLDIRAVADALAAFDAAGGGVK